LRTALISAIAACAAKRFRKTARNFLQGLSTDELQYIAEYLGACVLESVEGAALSRAELAAGIAQFARVRQGNRPRGKDYEHKMILLLEYLCRCQLTHCSPGVRARGEPEPAL